MERVKFIFQNPKDLAFFKTIIDVKNINHLFHLIPGSGLPSNYLQSTKEISNNKKGNLDFIYCARLEKSKGINLFIQLADYFPKSRFFIYGSLDNLSTDYLSMNEIINTKKRSNNITFMDYVENPLLRHHNDHSIFLVPSNYGEGLPRGIFGSHGFRNSCHCN